MTYAKAHPSNTANVIANNSDQTDSLPEDKFHIKLPANVDQYTGVPKDEITEGRIALALLYLSLEFNVDCYYQ